MLTIEEIAIKHTARLADEESDYSEFDKLDVSKKERQLQARRRVEDDLERKRLVRENLDVWDQDF
jgi:hypothetical protein